MKTENYILVTGGAGYIGSHTALELIDAGDSLIDSGGPVAALGAGATTAAPRPGWPSTSCR